ncbi:MAG: hypothetical protein M3536_00255 [Actinomycetota bacterium]|nr:hypothetical protein [Actinomycetota bacterium]
MTYTYTSRTAHLSNLQIRQQIAAAEVERDERELSAIIDAERELRRLQRRREQVARDLTQARERTTIQRRQLTLPLPIYGGPVGLLAAAEESRRHTRHKKGMAA